MVYDPHLHHRRSIRLSQYDYSQAGAYFLTICTQHRECLFSEVVDGEMRLNEAGTIVAECWQDIAVHFEDVGLDVWIVMTNHVHGIIQLTETTIVGARSPRPRNETPPPGRARTLAP